DNGSTDGTAALARAWCEHDPDRRRMVSEPVAGLSRARNRGVAAARGDVVLFIDDDALAPRGWAAAHLVAYDRDPDVVGVGGPVVLRWPDGRPSWLAPRLEHWFSALDHGDVPTAFPPPHGPYGTNMSLRRAAFTAAGGFDERLGRRGRSLVSSEEADLFARVWATGGRVAYEPAALVLHGVGGDRLRRRWVLRRGWAQGRSNARRLVLDGAMDGSALTTVCRAEAGTAVRGIGEVLRSVAAADQAAVLDEVARRSGHAAAAVELVWLRVRDGAGGRSSGRSVAVGSSAGQS
ncbi:MAG: glycosyltransferase, partial [Acidimicrobiales bacterium]|nr:glycosyltransferase [Acidimicrobiales bacterium]